MSNLKKPNNPDKYPTNGLIDGNTYYHAGNIWAYPASNSVDKAKLLSELNLRNVNIDIVDKNYVVEPNPEGYAVSFDGDQVNIQPGKAIINGFEVLVDEVAKYRLPTEDEIYKGKKYIHRYEGYALLCLHTIFDSMENLSGNIQVGETWYFEGITICYPSAEEYEAHENEYLLLGGVKPDGTTKEDEEKFTRIDAKYILVRMEPDPETGAPPLWSTDLLTFINNYLHGYWVSKAGDHEYGNLTFRKKPDKYLEPNFDYKTEDPLYDTLYALKLGRIGITSALSDNFNAFQEGYINIKKCDYNQNMQPKKLPKNYERHTNIMPLGMYLKDGQVDKELLYDQELTAESGYKQLRDIFTAQKFNAYIGYCGVGRRKQMTNNSPYLPLYPQTTYTDNTMLFRISAGMPTQESTGNKLNFWGNNLQNVSTPYTSNIIFDYAGGALDAEPKSLSIDYGTDSTGTEITKIYEKSFDTSGGKFGNINPDHVEELRPNFKISFDSAMPGYNRNLYVGSFCETSYNKLFQNDLMDINNCISTTYAGQRYADGIDFTDKAKVEISSEERRIRFTTQNQETYIQHRKDSKKPSETWRDILDIGRNIEVEESLWAHKYLVVGTQKDVTNSTNGEVNINAKPIGTDPSQIEVPDFVNTGGYRKLQAGDIYATQVWCGVYNDIAEIFDLNDAITGKEIVGLVVAYDKNNKCVVADKKHKNIIGIVSENPGICTGGQNCKQGVPVALAGRVKVKYEGRKLKPGDFVGLSNKTPGYVSKCFNFSKYRCGKVLRVLDKQYVEVLVLL